MSAKRGSFTCPFTHESPAMKLLAASITAVAALCLPGGTACAQDESALIQGRQEVREAAQDALATLYEYQPAARLFLGLLLALAAMLQPHAAFAQVQQGATLTILRGQVAIIRPNGSALQPAPNGSTVDVGDEIRTISKSGAPSRVNTLR